MGMLDKLTDLEKRLESLAAKRRANLEPIELRAHVLDDIEAHVEPVGDGRFRLPCNHVRVTVATTAARRAAYEAVFGAGSGFRDTVLRRLRDARAGVDESFDVSLKVTTKPAAPGEAPFRVDYLHRKAAAPPPAARSPRAQLVVTKGTAAQKVYPCSGPRINIGRVEEVVGADHHVVRRNHLAFAAGSDPVNETVSRSHAHIRYDRATGQFRLHDDRSSYGTRIFRDGRTIEVPSARGALLRSGDEISFGRASVRFVVR